MADEKPLAWWERGGPRRALVLTFFIAVILTAVLFFQDLSAFYDGHSWLKNLLATITVGLGLLIAFLEFLHSGEANEHRDQMNRLTEKANEHRQEANRLNTETLTLQTRIHVLQEDIERNLTKVRLYVRAQKSENGIAVQLLLSNLSGFDLWTNQVRLVVTESLTAASPGTYVIGGGKRISRGHTENGYLLHGTILKANHDQVVKVELKFYVQVEAVGVSDKPLTVESPEYEFKQLDGRVVKLEVLRYPPFAVSPDAGGSAP